MLDVLLKNVEIYDGNKNKPYISNVGVKGEKIVAINNESTDSFETIDCTGLSLMPGIIDNHTHYDAQITWDSDLNSSSIHGVSTVVMGNCGFTIAPCRESDRDLTMRNLTHVEGMSLETLRNGINWNFTSFEDYLDFLDSKGSALNTAVYCGHSSLRTYTMGSRATRENASPSEVNAMKDIVSRSLKAGACGFSTTLSGQHNGENGIPMPSRLASESELIELCQVVGDFGHGTLMLTKAGNTPIDFIKNISEKTNRPFIIAALLHSNLTPEVIFNDLDKIKKAQKEGIKLYGAVSPCPLTMEFTFNEPYVFEGLKSWNPLMSATTEQFRNYLHSKNFRDEFKAELSKKSVRLFNGEWDKVFVVNVKDSKNSIYIGKSIKDIAFKLDVDPVDFIFDLALSENFETVFTATLLNSDEDAITSVLQHEASLVSLSDAGAHLTFFSDNGYGLHLLGHWVRDKKVLSLEEAIYKLTKQNAEIFGIDKRGSIELGNYADLLLFDKKVIGRGNLKKINDLPGSGSRLMTPAYGVSGLWVNGKRIIADGKRVNEAHLPGKLIRQFVN